MTIFVRTQKFEQKKSVREKARPSKVTKILHFIKDKIEMLNVFDRLKSFFTFRRTNTDGLVFKLHYRGTVCIILASCLMVATSIHSKELPSVTIKAFCWIHSTFSIKSAFTKRVGIDISHLGIENSASGQKPRKEYGYYQWVVFFLLLQVSGRFRH